MGHHAISTDSLYNMTILKVRISIKSGKLSLLWKMQVKRFLLSPLGPTNHQKSLKSPWPQAFFLSIFKMEAYIILYNRKMFFSNEILRNNEQAKKSEKNHWIQKCFTFTSINFGDLTLQGFFTKMHFLPYISETKIVK